MPHTCPPRRCWRVALPLLLTLLSRGTVTRAAPVISPCSRLPPACACADSAPSELPPSITCNFTTAGAPDSPLLASAAGQQDVSLNVVRLAGNGLTALPADFFRGVASVSSLRLGGNGFTDVPPAIQRLQSLVSLDLSDNALEQLQMEILTTVPELQHLNLAHNRLRRLTHEADAQPDPGSPELPSAPSSQLPHVVSWNLSHNAIETIDDDFFKAIGHLSNLDLSYNKLTKITEHTFHTLKFSLAALDLSHNIINQMESKSVEHLSHLRNLNLSFNILNDLSKVTFPAHLEHLDVSHCSIKYMNHCQLSTLTDLTSIQLFGNDLQCSCQLYLLYAWYSNRHHPTTSDANAAPANWTCRTDAQAQAQAQTTPSQHVTDSVDSEVLVVSQQQGCQDKDSHCHSLEHREHHQAGGSQMDVSLDVVYSGMNIMASWTVVENGDAIIDSFRLSYIPEDSSTITSPKLSHETTSYTLTRTEQEKHFRVCLDVLAADAVILHQECHNFKDEPANVVVGILAGVIFLFPCAVAIAWIIARDRRVRRTTGYRVLGEITSPWPEKKGKEGKSDQKFLGKQGARAEDSGSLKEKTVDSECGQEAAEENASATGHLSAAGNATAGQTEIQSDCTAISQRQTAPGLVTIPAADASGSLHRPSHDGEDERRMHDTSNFDPSASAAPVEPSSSGLPKKAAPASEYAAEPEDGQKSIKNRHHVPSVSGIENPAFNEESDTSTQESTHL